MVDRLERLINLVIALRETRRPLTVDAINTRVAGYEGERDEAWRRMFERDKADLRDLGVPLRTEKVDRFDETLGYRIDPADYDLPDVTFSPAELTALALAVQLTGLGDDAAPGLDKLAVDADADPRRRTPGRLPLELGLDAPNRGVLIDALRTRRRVRFTYAKPGEVEASPRRVEPHALLHHRGRWYLRGLDRDRGATRTFRLDRISGDVRLQGEAGAFEMPTEVPDPREVVPGADVEPVDAVVRASPAVALSVARRARGAGLADLPADVPRPDGDADAGPEEDAEGGWRRFVVRVTDPDAFVGWVLDLGPEVEVVGPPELRAQVVAHLRGVLR